MNKKNQSLQNSQKDPLACVRKKKKPDPLIIVKCIQESESCFAQLLLASRQSTGKNIVIKPDLFYDFEQKFKKMMIVVKD